MPDKKKTKIHKRIDGRLLQMDKKFSSLKMKQKDKIARWVYEEYKRYVMKHEKNPNADEKIISAVLQKIEDAQIWIPAGEIVGYYRRKKPHLRKRLEKEKQEKLK